MLRLKNTIDFKDAHPYIVHLDGSAVTGETIVTEAFKMLTQHCHAASYNRGWWHDPITQESLLPGDNDGAPTDWTAGKHDMIEAVFPLVVAAKIALIHSEVSEMLEAHRCGHWDDKIPFPGMTAEGADIMIRLFDLFGMLQWAAENKVIEHHEIAEAYQLANALLAKVPYNAKRADHALANRAMRGGKKY